MAAKFSPIKLGGQPIKVQGTIVYNFVLGGTDEKDGGIKQVSGGQLNGKALYLPAPNFPPAARAVRASGAVNVQILIDENGMVASAAAVSGHPLLRAAAVEAAKKAQFSPTFLNGQPVKVSGVLTYNFDPSEQKEN
jgi:TonB family protein